MTNKIIPYASKFLLLLSGFVALYLTAKFFGPFDRGIIASSTALVSLIAIFGGLSIGRTIIFEIEKKKVGALVYFKENFISILALITALMVLSLLIAFIWLSTFPVDIPRPILIGSFFVLPYFMWSAYSSFIFSSLDKLILQSMLIIVNELVYILALFLVLSIFKMGIIAFIVTTAIFRFTSLILEIAFLIKIVKPSFSIHLKSIQSIIKNGLQLHLDSIGGYFIASVNILVVNSLLDKNSVGQFDLSMRLTTIMLVIPTISQVYISGHISKFGLKNAWGIVHKNAINTVIVLLISILFAFFLAKILVIQVFGEVYLSAAVNLRWLLPYVFFNSLCMLFNPFALSKGYFKTMSFLTIFLGLLNVSLGYLLIPAFGIIGMIYATNIVYIVAFLINIFYYFKIKKEVFAEN